MVFGAIFEARHIFYKKYWFVAVDRIYFRGWKYSPVAWGSNEIDYLLLIIDYWEVEHSQISKLKIVNSQCFWGRQYHGVADSSLRWGQIGPGQNGLRDKCWIGYLLLNIDY